MPELPIPISQIIRNYTLNLPAFPPADPASQAFHRFRLGFYSGFQAASLACGISAEKQPEVLEKVQKTLWAFGRYAAPGEDAIGLYLEMDRGTFLENLKISRPEEVFALMDALGILIALRIGGWWSTGVS